jgi:hypothetical protein
LSPAVTVAHRSPSSPPSSIRFTWGVEVFGGGG